MNIDAFSSTVAGIVMLTAATASAQSIDCRIEPDSTSKEFNEKLGKCSGVLKPPAVGDHEIVETVDPKGDMPVIKPGDLPADEKPRSR